MPKKTYDKLFFLLNLNKQKRTEFIHKVRNTRTLFSNQSVNNNSRLFKANLRY